MTVLQAWILIILVGIIALAYLIGLDLRSHAHPDRVHDVRRLHEHVGTQHAYTT